MKMKFVKLHINFVLFISISHCDSHICELNKQFIRISEARSAEEIWKVDAFFETNRFVQAPNIHG